LRSAFHALWLSALLSGFAAAAEETADPLQPFRAMTEARRTMAPAQLDEAIGKLEQIRVDDVEKPYLLGMLHFMRAFTRLSEKGRSAVKMTADEAARDPAIQADFQKAKTYYDAVEKARPAYKFIYCRYAELYQYSFDRKGMSDLANRLAAAPPDEQTTQCKKFLTDVADEYGAQGYAPYASNIYRAIVASWKPFPEYMLEAIGDAEEINRNKKQARLWWKRCATESSTKDRRDRCQSKLAK